jgi:hypothetical protein
MTELEPDPFVTAQPSTPPSAYEDRTIYCRNQCKKGKPMRYLIGLGFFALTFVSASAAQRVTLANLYNSCTSSSDGEKATCKYYILGVFEGAQLTGESIQDKSGKLRELSEKRYCVPEALSPEAIELTVKMKMGQDLAVFPQDRTMPAVSFVTAVMANAFSCTNK